MTAEQEQKQKDEEIDINRCNQLFGLVGKILIKSDTAKEERRQRGELFNVFRVCGVNHYETRHSAILAELLNPSGSHGQTDAFLSIFLEDTGLKDFGFNTSTAVVQTESSMANGRIDILINDNRGKIIIIENKIYAADQNEQLKRYAKFARDNYGDGNFRILYLTLNGHYASGQSGDGVEYITISYGDEILKWIRDCMVYCASKPIIRETLVQYANLIKELTNQSMDAKHVEELLKEMANHADEVAAMYNHFDEYREFVMNTYLKPQLEKVAKDLGLELACNWSAKQYTGFSLRKKEWQKCGILFQSQSTGYGNYIWGISCHRDSAKLDYGTLSCLQNSNNPWWQLGYSKLEYNMDVNTMRDIVNGKFIQYIKACVTDILKELEAKNIQLP